MYGGHVESEFVLQNYRCWQVILTLLNIRYLHIAALELSFNT